MNRRRNGRRSPYFGSVRFFRHLILTTIALLIIIPTGLSIFFGMQYKKLTTEQNKLYSENAALKSQIDALVKETEEAEAEAEEASVSVSSDKYGDILVDMDSWELILVNDTHPLNSGFGVNLAEIQPGQQVDKRIIRDLQEMLDAAEEEGHELHVYSAFRDMKKQQSLFNDCMKRLQEEGLNFREAFYESKARIALPGTSEHQTGLAVDIAAKDYFYLDESRGNQEEARWLAKNSFRFGFILRYPQHKESITGIRYEPEHFRYVGKTIAKFIADNDLTLEEFHDILKDKNSPEES